MPIKNSASMKYVPTPSAGREVMARKQTGLLDRIAANWNKQGGMQGLLDALSQDATRIGGKIEKGVSDVGSTMRLPHGTKPEAYDAVTGAAINTMGLGYGPAVGRMAMGNLRPNPAQMNIGVWQGGPNKYGPEGAAKSLDHIGKGEGAQAYGWGRYDAESPDVAKQYQEALSGREIRIDGNAPNWADPGNVASLAIHEHGSGAVKHLQDTVAREAKWDGASSEQVNVLNEAIAMLKSSESKLPDVTYEATKGNIYKHDIPDADVERYLDWDKPLSEQPESVRAALANIPEAKMIIDAPRNFQSTSGETLYNTLREKAANEVRAMSGNSLDNIANSTGPKQAASEALGKAGIPGLKYYDGMSRKNKDGFGLQYQDGTKSHIFATKADAEKALKANQSLGYKGTKLVEIAGDKRTRNFVTWDQDVLNRMKLLERNGEEF